jgi:serine/threonine protein kinase/WD40 repeat protein
VSVTEAPAKDDLRRRAERLFQEAAELRFEARERFLDRHCDEDASLRDSVSRLLAAFDRMGEFLEFLPDGRPRPEPDDADPIPTRIGGYEIVRVVGIGGMGIVYEALQKQPHRRVALKVIHPALVSSRWRRRFRREAEILGRLQHPAIAQIHEAGFEEVIVPERPPARLPYLAMEYVDGVAVNKFADDRGLDTRARLELVASICDGVQHAHEHGVVHRDLKPNNILVDGDGRPKVLDFGVARATGADWRSLSVATESGHIVGTIPYGSPEQVGGKPDEIDARTDVYSLGAILFELLSGRLPIDVRDRSLPEALRAIREDEPSRLSSLDSAFRGDIDAIVGKALRKEKERRYASAGELAADIRRYLQSQPIHARPIGTIYQLRKFTRRNKILVGGVAATIAALAIGLALATTFARREATQRRATEAWAEQAESALAESRLDEAVTALAARDIEHAAASLDAIPDSRRGWEWRHLRWHAGQRFAELPPPPEGLRGATAASRSSLLFTAGGDGVVRVWDFVTAEQVREFATGFHWFYGTAASPDGTALVALVSPRRRRTRFDPVGSQLVMWDVQSGEERWRRPIHASGLGEDAFSPDGSVIAVGTWDRRVILMLDAATGQTREEISVPDNTAQRPNFSPDGRRLVYNNALSSVVVDRPTGRMRRFPARSFERFMRAGEAVLGIRADSPRIVLLDLVGKQATPIPGTNNLIPVPGPEGQRLMIAGDDGPAVVVLHTLDDARPFAGRGSFPVAWSAGGTRLATRRAAGSIHIWDAATDARPLRITTPHRYRNEIFSVSPDGTRVVTAGWSYLTLYDLSTGDELWNSYRLEPYAEAIVFSPDGRQIALAGETGQVTVIDAGSGEPVRVFPASAATVVGLAWSRAGRGLVVAGREGTIRILDPGSGAIVRELEQPGGEIVSFAVDREGVRVAAGVRLGRSDPAGENEKAVSAVAVWEIPSGRSLGVVRLEGRPLAAVALDDVGQRVAGVTSTGDMVVVDIADGELLAMETDAGAALQSIEFAPSGERIVAGGNDGKLRIWDARTYRHLVFLETELVNMPYLRFLSDESTLVVGGGEAIVVLESGRPAAGFEARAHAGEVRRLVNDSFLEHRFSKDVINHLRAEQALPDEIRRDALQLARVRGDHVGWLNSDATIAYRATALPPEEWNLVLRKIELVNEIWPDKPQYVANLGKCQYRVGDYRRALDNLERAGEIYRAAGRVRQPEDWAFVAMAHWHLGARKNAATALRHLESSMAEVIADDEPWNRLFYDEARALVGP